MDTSAIVQEWFDKWESGDFLTLPLADHFKHTSPYGTINGKKQYLELVQFNKDKFLGHQFLNFNELLVEISINKVFSSNLYNSLFFDNR